jgi:hypothetical protein
MIGNERKITSVTSIVTSQSESKTRLGGQYTTQDGILIEGENLGINNIILQISLDNNTGQNLEKTGTIAQLSQYIRIGWWSGITGGSLMYIYANPYNSTGEHWDNIYLHSTVNQAAITETAGNTWQGMTTQIFNLQNIDDMRNDLLGGQYIGNDIGYATQTPYRWTTGFISAASGGNQIPYNTFPMQGLGIKCYQSDRFNNWMDTTWNDLITSTTKINTGASDSFNIADLILQEKTYNLLNRILLSGNTYRDWQEAVYGHRGTGELEIPEWVGGGSSEIVFDEVISTSSAETEALGTLGGRGREHYRNKNIVKVTANEPLFIMGIVSITPRIGYSQGNKFFFRFNDMNDLHKPELDGIGFQDLLIDELAGGDTIIDEGGNPQIYNSLGKQLAWTEYMTNVDQIHGNFAIEQSEEWMTLNRPIRYNEEGKLDRYTTYVDTIMSNIPFATTSIDSQHFWLQLGVDIKMSRVISNNQIPRL